MTHTIRAQYDLIAGKEALASDFGAMLDWIEQWDMRPCSSVYFGEEVNALLVRNWIAFRNSLTNTLNQYERSFLEDCAREACEPEDFYEIQDCMDEITDGQLMALGRLFYPNSDEIAKVSKQIASIAVKWCVEDVQSIRPDLTDEQAGAVLQAADRCHNAEVGINWDVLRFHADDLFPEEDEDIDLADELLPESSEVNSKYADSIIAGNPSHYDAIEVHGVRNINDADDPDGTHYEVDDENPELYSVYLHCVGGGIECVGDFSSNALAEEYASELSVLYSWKVLHFPLVVIDDEDESAEELLPMSSEASTGSEFSPNDHPVFRCLRGFHTEQFVTVDWDLIYSIDPLESCSGQVACIFTDSYDDLESAAISGAVYFGSQPICSRAELEGALIGHEMTLKATGVNSILYFVRTT
jgi:hypothetical protein